MKKFSKPAANSSMLTSCIIGVLAALGITSLFGLISAICISSEYFSVKTIQYLALFIQFAGVFVGCLLTRKIAADRKLFACLITAGGALLVQLCGAMLFFDGISSRVIGSIIAAFLGALCANSLGNLRKKSPAAARKRKRYR